jgi:hypothetical protein
MTDYPFIVGSHAIKALPSVMGIYGIMFWPTSRFYVGSSNDIRSRCCDHRTRLRSGSHSNRLLQDVWNANDDRTFLWIAIKSVSNIENLLPEEKAQISILRGFEPYGGFNLNADPVMGSLSESSRAKLRQRLAAYHPTRGQKLSSELCAKYSASVRSRAALSGAFKGVSFDERTESYMARIYASGRQLFLGRYGTEIEAAQAYNIAALEHYGPSGYLNPVPNGDPARRTTRGRPARGATYVR